MITLNILPPRKKQELQLAEIYIIIKNSIILILFLTIIAAIILLLAKITLQNQFNKIIEQGTLTTKVAKVFNQDIREFNQRLAAVSKIQKDYIDWTKFLIGLTQLIPEDVKVDSITIDGNKILVSGLAKSRTQFLALKDNLENSELFSNVVVPLENLLKKDNVDFDLKADINLDQIKL